MIGRFQRARRGQRRASHSWTGARTPPTRSSPRASRRACPRPIVGNGAELPRFEQLDRARACSCRSRASRGSGRVRRSASTASPTVSCAAPSAADAGAAWTTRARAAVPGAVGDRPLAGVRVLDFTAFWAGPVRRPRGSPSMGADVIKVEAVQRPDGIRFSAAVRPQRRSAVLREVGAVPRVQPRQARDHARPRPSRRPRAREAARRAQRRRRRELHARRSSSSSGSTRTPCARSEPDAVMLRMPAFGLDRSVARPPRASRRRWSSSPAWRG